MAAEQIIPNPPAGRLSEQQPDAALPDREKRRRKRKKHGRHEDNNRPAGAEGLIVSGTDIVWDRATEGPADRTPRVLGKKAFAASELAPDSRPVAEAPPLPPPIKAFETVPSAANPAAEKPQPAMSVAAYERMAGHDSDKPLPPAARQAGAKAAEAAMAAGSRPETVSLLDRREVLSVAKSIKIDGVSVKEIFDANRIDESGLRAVVETYLQGGDYRRQLGQEITAKESSYELDPRIRHDRKIGERPIATGPASRPANTLFEQAKGAASQIGGKALRMTQSTGRKAAKATTKVVSKGAASAQRNMIDNSSLTDWLSITAVVIVYSIILILLLR